MLVRAQEQLLELLGRLLVWADQKPDWRVPRIQELQVARDDILIALVVDALDDKGSVLEAIFPGPRYEGLRPQLPLSGKTNPRA